MVIILRRSEFVRRHVIPFDVYRPEVHGNLASFIKQEYLIDVDLFDPWTFQLHLVQGKPIAFLAFDYELILQRDEEFMNYLILRVQKRLRDFHHESLQFALMELPYFPSIKKQLNLNFD
jgi:hypothetical protein